MRELLRFGTCLVVLLGSNATQRFAQADSAFAIPASDEGLPGSGPIRRYDWFQNLWAQRRTEWSQQIDRDQGAVVFLGDSITQGWGPRLGNAFPGVKVANRGISGDTTRGMLLRLREDVLALNPSGVVMLMGTNDLEESAEPATIAGNLRLIVEQLKAHDTAMPIVLCHVFPSSAEKKRPSSAIKQVNRLYSEVVQGDPQITVVDTWTLFANDSGDARPEEFPDLLHPNRAGYRKWAAALRPILATLGYLERDIRPFETEPGCISLFNGEDLDGWMYRPSSDQDKRQRANWRKNDPNAPPWPIITEPHSLDNQFVSHDGRYAAINGRLVVTTPPEGRKIQQIWTQREFPEDFVLRLEFRATPNADSGIFVRGRQLQCRDYALAGPYSLARYKPQDWNEIVISVIGQSAYCTCNGELIDADFSVPATGPIGLEGDRGQVEYRRIRVKRINRELPRSDPEQQGVSSTAVLAFIDGLDAVDSVHSVMLLRHGTVVAEGWWSPFQPRDVHQLYSLSKSFTSTAVGLAIAEGKLSLDDAVVSFFPDDAPDTVSSNLAAMRVRDLLSMSTGHVAEDLSAFSFASESVLTKDFLALPVRHTPGTHFLYNTPATYMCSAIVQQVTGESLLEFLGPRLFEPLGIQGARWSESHEGVAHGGYGLSIKTEDIARFGQLYLQNGQWNGRQVVPADWIAMATSRQTSNGSNPNSDWNQGYGYQFWRCRHDCYRGDGAFGQFCIVMPEHDVVLAITSGARDMGAIMQLTWDHLLPGLHDEALPPQPQTASALKDRLSKLELRRVKGQDRSPRIDGKRKFSIATNDQGIEWVEYDFPNKTFTLKDAMGEHQISLGTSNAWNRRRVVSAGPLLKRLTSESDVAAASNSAWTDAETLQTRVWFYESPFRVDMTSHFEDDTLHLDVKQNLSFGPAEFQVEGRLVDD